MRSKICVWNIIEYLRQSIDEKSKIEKWNAKEYLNMQLAGNYDFFLVHAVGNTFLLAKPDMDYPIAKTKIQMQRIEEKSGYDIALLLENPTAYKIKKLIESKIAFITIDKQMYLPFMALHIKKTMMLRLQTGKMRGLQQQRNWSICIFYILMNPNF